MDLPERIVLASANPAKARELAAVLDSALPSRVILEPRPEWVPEVDEDAEDFEGNARLKAVALCEATGLASLSDDSGLEVDGLGGRPGVHSARYAGPDAGDAENVRKLLRELSGVPADDVRRAARFRCVVVLRTPGGAEVVASGSVEGHIATATRGQGGFGYDPVFVPTDGDGRTFGEMDAGEKHSISHRGRALAELAALLGAPT
ncbi:MAG: RdgB/HAM1 family non-canonical purine NTP pyrophosphatase [Microthrixaceae bacterium]|nr:RdgB/HAM1 family non-canonical purine NTP pyrophosphatase [Microthrixaceae bacterium]MCO5322572.1 RdgB/HAM1 family non-canonical purine NTP pyrophosphatase [Microthrixaceae bacterium]